MVNFPFSRIHHLLWEIDLLIMLSSKNAEVVERFGGHNDPRVKNEQKLQDATKEAIDAIDYVEKAHVNLLQHLQCVHIDGAAKRLGHWKNLTPPTWFELKSRSIALRNAIANELKEHYFYQYPKERGKKLAAWKTDWQKSIAAFSEIQADVWGATDCYALQHHTASVFYSMRVAEHGLRALAKERRIRLPRNKAIEWATWQEVIKGLDDEIKNIGSRKAGKAKDAALSFYSGARADLNGFKDEYRNLVMHVRATYDEFQALRALTNVNAFMERLAEKIDHAHKRITWGRF